MKSTNITCLLASCIIMTVPVYSGEINPQAKMHKFSTVVEKERPELDETTKRLIAEYRREPSESNRKALRKQVEKRYDAVVARKKGQTGGAEAHGKGQVESGRNAGDRG